MLRNNTIMEYYIPTFKIIQSTPPFITEHLYQSLSHTRSHNAEKSGDQDLEVQTVSPKSVYLLFCATG